MGKMTLSQMVAQLAGGMGTSIQIFVVTLVFSLPLGLIVAFGRMTKNGFLRNLVKVYISIMRGTPLMLQFMVANSPSSSAALMPSSSVKSSFM